MSVKNIVFFILSQICILNFAYSQSKMFTGYIKNKKTNEVIPFATIFEVNNKKGTTTDLNGYFELSLKKHDSLFIEISHINYHKLTANFLIGQDTNITYYLSEKQLQLNEVVVSASYKSDYENTSYTRISSKQLNGIPSLGGEKDIIKALQLTPGVQGGIEGTNGLIVRGGEPGQNLYLVDNMSIYSPSHLYGFFSTFNSDIIYSADLVRAGLSANYGGKLSSLVDIRTKKPSYDNLNAIFSLGLVSSKLYTEIPIIKGKSALLFSYRRSYFDLLTTFKAKYDMENEKNKINFYDIYVKYEHNINKKNVFSINYLGSKDKFYYIFNNPESISKSEDISGVNWVNSALFVNYKHFKEDGNNFSLFSGVHTYEYNYINDSYFSGSIEDSYKKTTSIKDFSVKLESENKLTDKFNLIYGGSFIHHNLFPLKVYMLNNLISKINEESDEIAIFLHSYFNFNDRNTISFGLRQNWYFYKSVSFFPIEPRISLINNLGDKLTIKSSVSRNVQFIHRIENFSAGMPTETWHVSNNEISYEDGYQISTEIIKKISAYGIIIGISPYYKWMNGLAEYGNFYSDFPLPTSVQNNLYETKGNGKAYGIELFSNKQLGFFNYSISYILSKSVRKFEKINDDNWYPSNYDRRHYFNFNIGYSLKDKYLLSALCFC